MNIEKAKEELKEVNNGLTLLMKQKKALQQYIDDETDRIKNVSSPRSKAYELKKDVEFIKLYGRERTAKEIGLIMHYSERQIQRFLKEN